MPLGFSLAFAVLELPAHVITVSPLKQGAKNEYLDSAGCSCVSAFSQPLGDSSKQVSLNRCRTLVQTLPNTFTNVTKTW